MPEEGFLTDLHTAEVFFRVCKRYKIVDRDCRLSLVRSLAKRGRAKYLRDISAVTQGKRVARITRKRGDNAN